MIVTWGRFGQSQSGWHFADQSEPGWRSAAIHKSRFTTRSLSQEACLKRAIDWLGSSVSERVAKGPLSHSKARISTSYCKVGEERMLETEVWSSGYTLKAREDGEWGWWAFEGEYAAILHRVLLFGFVSRTERLKRGKNKFFCLFLFLIIHGAGVVVVAVVSVSALI